MCRLTSSDESVRTRSGYREDGIWMTVKAWFSFYSKESAGESGYSSGIFCGHY